MPKVSVTNLMILQNQLLQSNTGIACVTETWFSDATPTDFPAIPGYHHPPIRKDRGYQPYGGLVCYIKEHLHYKHWSTLSTSELETAWFTVRPKRMPRQHPLIICGAIYHPPKAPKGPMIQHIHTSLDHILQQHPTAGIIVMGDYNTLPHGELCRSYNLKQVVTHPTRKDKVLDKIITNLHSLYTTPTVLAPLGLSDHGVVTWHPQPVCSLTVAIPKVISRRRATHNNKTALVEELTMVNWTPLYQMDSCQEKFYFFQDTMDKLINKHLPIETTKVHPTDKPWITPYYKNLVCRRQCALRNRNTEGYRTLRKKVNICLRAKFLQTEC